LRSAAVVTASQFRHIDMDVNSKALRFIIATSACSKCQTFAQ
jgi:hypothetical protein